MSPASQTNGREVPAAPRRHADHHARGVQTQTALIQPPLKYTNNMPRPRKIKTPFNIPYVHESHGRIVYRPYIPPSERAGLHVDKNGFISPPIVIGKPTDSLETITRAWLAARESLQKQYTYTTNTLGWIVDQYLESRQFAHLSPRSQKDAKTHRKILEHPLRINGKESTLAHLHIRQLTQPLLHQIAEKRLTNLQNRGNSGVVIVNRETTFLSTAISWACNYIHDLGITGNPLIGFKKYKEQGRERFVTDEEFEIQKREAAHIRPWLPVLFDLTYLLACRGAEVLNIRLSDCIEKGIIVRRLKGSRTNLIRWSPALRQAYQAAIALHDKAAQTVDDPWLLCKRNGEAITSSGLHTYLQRLKRHMDAKGLGHIYWNLHALKHKAISESSDKKIAGHKTEAMRLRYDQSLPEHSPVR